MAIFSSALSRSGRYPHSSDFSEGTAELLSSRAFVFVVHVQCKLRNASKFMSRTRSQRLPVKSPDNCYLYPFAVLIYFVMSKSGICNSRMKSLSSNMGKECSISDLFLTQYKNEQGLSIFLCDSLLWPSKKKYHLSVRHFVLKLIRF